MTKKYFHRGSDMICVSTHPKYGIWAVYHRNLSGNSATGTSEFTGSRHDAAKTLLRWRRDFGKLYKHACNL